VGVVVGGVQPALGFPAEAQPIVERVFEPPQERRFGGERHPGIVPVGGDRFLLTWVDENPDGRGLHAQALGGRGEAVGPALDLSPADVSVIGGASAVLGDDGRGVVAFVASGADGFDVRTTPIVCAQ
jgi:hypothetical protein